MVDPGLDGSSTLLTKGTLIGLPSERVIATSWVKKFQTPKRVANSIDMYETAIFEPSHLDHYCLQRYVH